MLKAVIFDLDGLLVDTEIISYHVYREIFKKYNINISKESYVLNYCGKTDITSISNIIEEYKLPLSVKEGLKLIRERESEYIAKGVELKKGARELLDFLRSQHIKTALATSSDEKRARRILISTNINDMFDKFLRLRSKCEFQSSILQVSELVLFQVPLRCMKCEFIIILSFVDL